MRPSYIIQRPQFHAGDYLVEKKRNFFLPPFCRFARNARNRNAKQVKETTNPNPSLLYYLLHLIAHGRQRGGSDSPVRGSGGTCKWCRRPRDQSPQSAAAAAQTRRPGKSISKPWKKRSFRSTVAKHHDLRQPQRGHGSATLSHAIAGGGGCALPDERRGFDGNIS